MRVSVEMIVDRLLKMDLVKKKSRSKNNESGIAGDNIFPSTIRRKGYHGGRGLDMGGDGGRGGGANGDDSEAAEMAEEEMVVERAVPMVITVEVQMVVAVQGQPEEETEVVVADEELVAGVGLVTAH
ncbi:unnamed protein product [Ilex paraguariensis]|uniref:Uncharacterized protein n=1 Tax=Ilex paraguariensis TaxID=185542 RepID=A0ABC8QZX5_9AQUA